MVCILQFSEDLQSRIIDVHIAGKVYGIISKSLHIPQSTVTHIVNIWRQFDWLEFIRAGEDICYETTIHKFATLTWVRVRVMCTYVTKTKGFVKKTQHCVWNKRPENIIQTVKCGEWSIMIWGCCAVSGHGQHVTVTLWGENNFPS